MEFSTNKELTDKALASMPRSLPEAARKMLADFWVNRAVCGECGRRVTLGSRRVIRRVPGSHFVFHAECADRGQLRLRAEARTTQAMAAHRQAKAALARAKAWRV
jgi:hypothetical protein